jgi:KUP system potassium uptake protein
MSADGGPAPGASGPEKPAPRGRYLAALSLAALGVVYGDIGTSPLYAMREAFHGPHAFPVTAANVYGVLSLVFWSLALIISVKYLVFMLRADNRGEGGILALMALIQRHRTARGRVPRFAIAALGLFGASLLYGDSVITPAMTVLSAVDGLRVTTPGLGPFVLPLTIGVLLGLFVLQRHGTGGIGAIFGPVMTLWFATIGVLGLARIIGNPAVLEAVGPWHAVRFFLANGWAGFLVLGAVFLVVTGGEALYADMGHFGVRPIRLAWFGLVLPGLLLNYFGQGALLLAEPSAAENPFYRMAPAWSGYPLTLLATAAAVIASQAVISGAFSLTRQAMQLGYCPRMQIEHTSSREIGQIYVPAVNWALMIATIALVLGFGSSSRLAAAYGVAVSSDMVIATVLLFVASREVWGWSTARAALLAGVLLFIDLSFFTSNALKIPHGGWFPLLVGGGVFTLFTTWKTGRAILVKRMAEKSVPLNLLLADLAAEPPIRVPGTAVYMYGSAEGTPPALVHNLAHNKVLHEKVVFLTVLTEEVPHVPPAERVTVKRLGKGFASVVARYGFMEDPDIHEILDACRDHKLDVNIDAATFFLGRETLIASDRPGMATWREHLFSFLSRNALRATAFFRIPPNQVFEVGAQVEL